jgi:hypothetical protein
MFRSMLAPLMELATPAVIIVIASGLQWQRVKARRQHDDIVAELKLAARSRAELLETMRQTNETLRESAEHLAKLVRPAGDHPESTQRPPLRLVKTDAAPDSGETC